MPAVTRVSDNNTGHDSCPGVPLSAGSPNVFVNCLPVGRVGDPYVTHGCPIHIPHTPHLAAGSPNVFVNGIPVSRIGDAVDCGGSVAQGSPSVFINEAPANTGSSGGSSGGNGSSSENTGTTDGGNSSGSGESTGSEGGTESGGNAGGGSAGSGVDVPMSDAMLVVSIAANLVILKSWLNFKGTDEDDLIFCLPEIANAEAENANEVDRQGWLYLHDMFQRWLGGEANSDAMKNPNIFWVDWDWAMKYQRFSTAMWKLRQNSSLFTEKGKNKLVEILKRDGKFSTQRVDFDYTIDDSNFIRWNKDYFQQATINKIPFVDLDGLFAAFGKFNIRALAKGYTIPQFNGNGHTIVVDGISLFIWDSFNFDGEEYLGYWRCENPSFQAMINPGGYGEGGAFTVLHNSDFRKFREKYNSGNDFMILSHLKYENNLFSYSTDE